MSGSFLNGFFKGETESFVHEWAKKQLPSGIGYHGTTFGEWGRFDIENDQIKTMQVTKDLYLTHCPAIATRYALNLEASSTGNRSEGDGVDGTPGIITVLNVDPNAKLETQFGCLVIPSGSTVTCQASEICPKVSKVVSRAHLTPRLLGFGLLFGGCLAAYYFRGPKDLTSVDS